MGTTATCLTLPSLHSTGKAQTQIRPTSRAGKDKAMESIVFGLDIHGVIALAIGVGAATAMYLTAKPKRG